jgi:3-dehydroquinate synthase
MKVLKLIGKQNTSKIIIEKGLLREAAEFCRPGSTDPAPAKICIITDSNVAAIYLESLEKQLSVLNIPLYHHIMTAGEEFKTLATVAGIYEMLSDRQFGRDDMIIALGGGVTGDIAGFAAATYLRGIRHLIQIPTTLLAQVDSSVGGKTGVDLPQGKNLVGAFRQPDLVLIDPEVLETLPEAVYRAGMAEVIKYGCIWDPEILDLVVGDYKSRMIELIERCVSIKIKVVEEDETETGLRRILNFGHTLGHGVEKLGNFTEPSHGEAVAIGMAAAVKMGNRAGITKDGCYERLIGILNAFDLPTGMIYPVDEIYEAMLTDKKKQGDSINFIFIEDFGRTLVKKVPVEELKQMMKAAGEQIG